MEEDNEDDNGKVKRFLMKNSYQSEVEMFTFNEKSDYTQTKRL